MSSVVRPSVVVAIVSLVAVKAAVDRREATVVDPADLVAIVAAREATTVDPADQALVAAETVDRAHPVQKVDLVMNIVIATVAVIVTMVRAIPML